MGIMPEDENNPDPLKETRQKMQTVGEMVYKMHEQVAPTLEQIRKTKETFEKITKPLNDSLEVVKSFSQKIIEAEKERTQILPRLLPYHRGIPMEKIVYTPPRVQLDPADRKLLEEIRDQKKPTPEKNTSDLVYDKKEKILSRTVPGTILQSHFMTGEAKRVHFFERLLRAKKYVGTEDLRVEFDCPTKEAVRKMVQGINNKLKDDLALKKLSVIQGKPGSGYRINPEATIHIK